MAGAAAAQEKVRLEELDLTQVKMLAAPLGYPAKAGQSVAGTPLTIEGKVYAHGIGLHSGSTLVVELAGAAESFEAAAGMDDAKTALPAPLPGSGLPQGLQRHPGTGMVQVWVDGRRAADTGGMRRGGPVKRLAEDLRGPSG